MIVTMVTGGVDTGWTFTTPLSTHYVNTNVLSTGAGDIYSWIQFHLYRT